MQFGLLKILPPAAGMRLSSELRRRIRARHSRRHPRGSPALSRADHPLQLWPESVRSLFDATRDPTLDQKAFNEY